MRVHCGCHLIHRNSSSSGVSHGSLHSVEQHPSTRWNAAPGGIESGIAGGINSGVAGGVWSAIERCRVVIIREVVVVISVLHGQYCCQPAQEDEYAQHCQAQRQQQRDSSPNVRLEQHGQAEEGVQPTCHLQVI